MEIGRTTFPVKPVIAVLIMGILAVISVPKSLTGDESLTVTLAGETYSTMIGNISRDIHMPGYYSLLWIWVRIFGSSLIALRIFAFIPVAFLIYLGSRYYGKHGYLLLAASPFLLHLSVELRMYGLLAAVGMCLLICLRNLVESPSKKAFLLLALSCAAGIWIHYFAWTGVAASAAYLFLRKKRVAAVLLVIVCLLAVTPWAVKMINQVQNFAPTPGGDSDGLVQTATLKQRVMGMPFSAAGTLLRFSSGNSVFQFSLFSIHQISLWAVTGILLLGLSLLSVWKGRPKAGAGATAVFLFVLIPLSLLRPSARHFALAYPAYAALVAAGLDGKAKLQRAFRILIPLFSILMCIPFIQRTTMPQRCSFDRDFREAAAVAGAIAEENDLQLVVYLDSYSSMGILYHLNDEGFGNITVVGPHLQNFSAGLYFINDPGESLQFLMQDTDSLVQQWGDEFLLLANDPTRARGPLFGDENKLVGRGSDVMADLDLVTSLERYFTIERIPLRESEGPFTLFRAERF